MYSNNTLVLRGQPEPVRIFDVAQIHAYRRFWLLLDSRQPNPEIEELTAGCQVVDQKYFGPFVVTAYEVGK